MPFAKYLKCIALVVALFLGSTNVNAQQSDLVVFNVNSLKYHELGCTSANRCTKNCIVISRSEALRRGGVHCKNCLRYRY